MLLPALDADVNPTISAGYRDVVMASARRRIRDQALDLPLIVACLIGDHEDLEAKVPVIVSDQVTEAEISDGTSG